MRWTMKPQHKWIGMIILGVVFVLLGVGAAVLALAVVTGTSGRLAFAFIAVLFLVVGVIALAFAPRARRESGTRTDRRLVPAVPDPVTEEPSTPWPLPAVAAALAHELRDTPYVVAHDDEVIHVRWDLQDQSWWVFAQRNGTSRVFETRLVLAGHGRVTRSDHYYALDWQAGLPVVGSLTSSSSGGRVWRFEKRVELGTGADGVSPAVGYTLSTGDLNKPLQAVLDRAGWTRPKLGAEAKGALIVGIIGASAAVIVPIVLLVQWLMGR